MQRLIPLLALLALGQETAAQSSRHGPLLLDLPASARAAATGNAMMLSGTDSELIFYNPSLLDRAQGFAINGHAYSTESTMLNVSAAGDWFGGGVGFGLQVLEYGTENDDPTFVPGQEDDLLASGPIGVSAFAASVGYSRRFFGFRWGAAAKFVNRRVNGDQDGVVALDLAASGNVVGLTVGVAVQNLSENLEYGPQELSLPERVMVGVTSSTYSLGGLDFAGTFAVTRRADVEVVPGGGLEVSYWPVQGRTFIGRVGLKRVPRGDESPFTFGVGFRGDNIELDYAYQTFDDLDGAHRLGISFR